jgi:hypothetical protein
MSNTRYCPKCRSENLAGVALSPKQLRELGLPNFTILGYSKCQECTHIFERSVPTWIWWLGLVLGLLLTCPFLYVLILPQFPVDSASEAGARASEVYGTGTIATFGFIIILGCIRGLLRNRKLSSQT